MAKTLDEYIKENEAAGAAATDPAPTPAYELPPDVPTIEQIKEAQEKAWAAQTRTISLSVFQRGRPEEELDEANEQELQAWAELYNIQITRAAAMVATELPDLTSDEDEIKTLSHAIAGAIVMESKRPEDLQPGCVDVRYLTTARTNYAALKAETDRRKASGTLGAPIGVDPDEYATALIKYALAGVGALYDLDEEAINTQLNYAVNDYKEDATEQGTLKTPTLKIRDRGADNIDIPTDKLYRTVWGYHSLKAGKGVVDVTSHETKGGQKKKVRFGAEKVEVDYEIGVASFEDAEKDQNIKINPPRELTPYDNDLYLVSGALYKKYGPYMTSKQIYKTLRGATNPNADDVEKIMEAAKIMMRTPLAINNRQEHEKYGYPLFEYDSTLLPAEIVKVEVNGRLVDCIHLFREPPLISYGRSKKQITTVEQKVFAIPKSNTPNAASIRNYLLSRIAGMKNHSTYSRKIEYATMISECGIDTTKNRMQKSRARQTALVCLDHFKDTGYINGYAESDDKKSITIKLPRITKKVK